MRFTAFLRFGARKTMRFTVFLRCGAARAPERPRWAHLARFAPKMGQHSGQDGAKMGSDGGQSGRNRPIIARIAPKMGQHSA